MPVIIKIIQANLKSLMNDEWQKSPAEFDKTPYRKFFCAHLKTINPLLKFPLPPEQLTAGHSHFLILPYA